MKRLALLLAALTVLLPLIRGVTIYHEHFTLPEEEFMPVFEAIELLKDQMKGLEDSARKEINLYVLHSQGLKSPTLCYSKLIFRSLSFTV